MTDSSCSKEVAADADGIVNKNDCVAVDVKNVDTDLFKPTSHDTDLSALAKSAQNAVGFCMAVCAFQSGALLGHQARFGVDLVFWTEAGLAAAVFVASIFAVGGIESRNSALITPLLFVVLPWAVAPAVFLGLHVAENISTEYALRVCCAAMAFFGMLAWYAVLRFYRKLVRTSDYLKKNAST